MNPNQNDTPPPAEQFAAYEKELKRLESGRHTVRLGRDDTSFGKIDEEKSTIYGVAVTLQGEALGHGVHLDEKFIDDALVQASAMTDGMKIRFGHPGWLGDAIGTYLGRGINFRKQTCTRKDGTQAFGLYCDVVFSKVAELSPSGNLPAYMMALAKESPESAGMSICFSYGDYAIIDSEGKRVEWSKWVEENKDSYKGMYKGYFMWQDFKALSADQKLYAVLGTLHGADFTDDPAATDGVFSAVDGIDSALEAINKQRAMMGQSALVLSVEGELNKRVSGLQAEKDKEIAALKKQLSEAEETFSKSKTEFEAALAKAQAEASSKAEELESTRKDLAALGKQLEIVETAHATLTGAVLNPPDSGRKTPETFAAFMKEHGNSLSRAKKEDPETYKALMLKHGADVSGL